MYTTEAYAATAFGEDIMLHRSGDALLAENTAADATGLVMTVGTGAEATPGHKVSVHYTGWLDQSGKKGKKFDSSVERGEPFAFTLGAHQVIRGWDEGVAGMKVGGKRTLVIPPALGYGQAGAGRGLIPPNATLIFDVELLRVE